jgi:5-methylcytosine-specific restriction endonuclease McrA
LAPPWNESRIKNFIISLLRAGSRKWPPRASVLADAKTEKKINSKSGRLAQHYKCKSCKKDFPLTQVQVDHLNPVVDPATGFIDWNTYIPRMFCDEDNLQVLCTVCHTKKSNKEKKGRSASKQATKNK